MFSSVSIYNFEQEIIYWDIFLTTKLRIVKDKNKWLLTR